MCEGNGTYYCSLDSFFFFQFFCCSFSHLIGSHSRNWHRAPRPWPPWNQTTISRFHFLNTNTYTPTCLFDVNWCEPVLNFYILFFFNRNQRNPTQTESILQVTFTKIRSMYEYVWYMLCYVILDIAHIYIYIYRYHLPSSTHLLGPSGVPAPLTATALSTPGRFTRRSWEGRRVHIWIGLSS